MVEHIATTNIYSSKKCSCMENWKPLNSLTWKIISLPIDFIQTVRTKRSNVVKDKKLIRGLPIMACKYEPISFDQQLYLNNCANYRKLLSILPNIGLNITLPITD